VLFGGSGVGGRNAGSCCDFGHGGWLRDIHPVTSFHDDTPDGK
jgi:hypothetical protein